MSAKFWIKLKKLLVKTAESIKNQNYYYKFYRHNIKHLIQPVGTRQNNSVTLVEYNEMCSSHIVYSYLCSLLRKKNDSLIVTYPSTIVGTVHQRILMRTAWIMGLGISIVYRSFGASQLLMIMPTKYHKLQAIDAYEIVKNIKSKQEFENLVIKNILIGDLIYDTYLRLFNCPTIQLSDIKFKSFVVSSLELFFFWLDYFDQHNVKGLIISHAVYNSGMPARIAASKNIPVYQANISHLYKIRDNYFYPFADFKFYKDEFAKLPEDMRRNGITEAEKRIGRRFNGEIGLDMEYSTKSAYVTSYKKKALSQTNNRKILVATHCFFDSPHTYGMNIFPDFYEWIDFLGNLSEKTDYDWYIKTHPDYLPGNMDIIEKFLIKFPKFTLLDADISHHQLIEEGIDVALTVYGTIGFEYAALGKTVINCSVNNPHIAYNFNINPKSIGEYEEILLNLEAIKPNIDLQEVYEYYYMRYIYYNSNIFFRDYKLAQQMAGGYYGQFSPQIYDIWRANFSTEWHNQLTLSLDNFLSSEDLRFRI